MWPQEKTERLLKKQCIVFTGPRDRRRGSPCRATWERHQGGQEAEDRGGRLRFLLYWGFHRKVKAGQGEHLRFGQYE